MHKAIYREYRPDTFQQVLGQEHITTVLKNQIKNGKVGHAYIFSGTRGTGKTTCAKIFAKAINCLDPQDGSPCNKCENCKAVIDEATMDIVEMDAASNRRIDDIRDLRDKVIYPPQKLKYKVYIIDEAHMITNEGFNALLKIMEEPPRHLVFILATTEIEKVPQTILSRCQRYEFKRIEAEDIKKNMEYILKDLKIEMDPLAMDLVAREADGAMRDALSTLDQVVSTGTTHIQLRDVEDILGVVDQGDIFQLVNHVGKGDFTQAIIQLHTAAETKTITSIVRELTNHFRNMILVNSGLEKYIETGSEQVERYRDNLKNFTINRLVSSVDIMIEYEGRLKNTENPRIMAEMAISRLINYVSYDDLALRIKNLEDRIATMESGRVIVQEPVTEKVEKPKNEKVDIPKKETKAQEVVEAPTIQQEPEATQSNGSTDVEDRWEEFINSVPSPMIRTYLNQSSKRLMENGKLVILMGEDYEHYVDLLNTGTQLDKIRKGVDKVFGEDVAISIMAEKNHKGSSTISVEEKIATLERVFGKENIEIK